MADANQLHRELLRWIQSLDLAYSIKNVKRDFANGFLVAEILSRYYDKDVSLHSFDNGLGVKIKRDNWEQLTRVFGRIADLEPLANKTDIDGVIHCQNGAAVAFLTKLYTCLTQRTIQQPVVVASPPPASKPTDDSSLIPPYAKPTGTAVIRDKLRNADLAETNDESELARKVRGVHAQHEEQLQLERLSMETERFPALRSASKATVLRGATKPVRNDDAPTLVTQHVVKDVQIKSMNEKSLEKLRQTREAKQQQQQHDATGDERSTGLSMTSHSTSELIQKRRPLDLLNEAVGRKLPSAIVSRLETHRGRDKFDALLAWLEANDSDDHAACLTDVLDDPLVLAAAFLDFPKDFWKVSGALVPFLTTYDETHALFTAVHDALVTIGSHCVERDATAAMVLLTDDVLPRVTPLLVTHATKRAPLLRVVYAFTSPTVLSHIHVIKRLRDALAKDLSVFIHALSILLYMETDLDETLVDLYYYYGCIGLETPCDKLRAAALSMLVPLGAFDAALVADVLPRLTSFSSRHAWWEVKTQLVTVASAFLHSVASSNRDFTDAIELALTLVEREFSPAAHLNVRRVGLSALAKNLAQYQELVPLYVDVLVSLPLAMRANMLYEPDASLPVRGVSGAHYALHALARQWDAVAVAKQVYYERKQTDRADVGSLQILRACFKHAPPRDASMLYDQLQGFLALGLLDAAASLETTELLTELMRSGACAPRIVLASDAVQRALATLATRNADDVRQQRVVQMLVAARALDAAAVAQCVAAVALLSTDFSGSLLARALA